MKTIGKTIELLTNITKNIALFLMALMMLFISFAVISRALFTPVVGDVELVQLGMVVLIMCGLAYTEQVDGHIAIGLIVDRFSEKVQKVFTAIANLLTAIVTLVIGFVYFEVAMNHKNHMQLSSSLLDIPYYPIDFIIVLGFTLWGLQALFKMVTPIVALFESKQH